MSDQGDIGTIVGSSGDPAVNRDTFGTDLKDIEDRLELLIAEVAAARGSESDLQAALDAKQGTDQRNQNSGYAGLNSSGNVPAERLPDSTEFTTNKNQANGYAGLDGNGDIDESVLPSSVTGLQAQIDAKQGLAQKGQASGYAGLGADAKVPLAQLPEVVASLVTTNLGTWNASTNTPTIPAASSSNNGSYYVVAVAGSTDIDGETNWQIGDMLISNGTTWERVPYSKDNGIYATTDAIKALTTDDVAAGDVISRIRYASGHPILPARFRVLSGGLSSQTLTTERQGIYFENTAQTLTFILIHNGRPDARHAGAIADGGTTDDQPPCQACVEFLRERGGGTVELPAEDNHYRFENQGVTLYGSVGFEGTAPPSDSYRSDSVDGAAARDPYTVRTNHGTVIDTGTGFSGFMFEVSGIGDKGIYVKWLTFDFANADGTTYDVTSISDSGDQVIYNHDGGTAFSAGDFALITGCTDREYNRIVKADSVSSGAFTTEDDVTFTSTDTGKIGKVYGGIYDKTWSLEVEGVHCWNSKTRACVAFWVASNDPHNHGGTSTAVSRYRQIRAGGSGPYEYLMTGMYIEKRSHFDVTKAWLFHCWNGAHFNRAGGNNAFHDVTIEGTGGGDIGLLLSGGGQLDCFKGEYQGNVAAISGTVTIKGNHTIIGSLLGDVVEHESPASSAGYRVKFTDNTGPFFQKAAPNQAATNDNDTGWHWPGSDVLQGYVGGSQYHEFSSNEVGFFTGADVRSDSITTTLRLGGVGGAANTEFATLAFRNFSQDPEQDLARIVVSTGTGSRQDGKLNFYTTDDGESNLTLGMTLTQTQDLEVINFVKASSYYTETAVIADDDVHTFTMPADDVFIVVTIVDGSVGSSDKSKWRFSGHVWTADGPFIYEAVSGANTDLVNGGTIYTGTSGVDGNLSIQANATSNRLFIENRTGDSRTFSVAVLGSPEV